MEIRGERRCKDCGTVWSYAETGSVACPDCGSRYSVGVDERTRQTDKPVAFDLSAARNAVDVRSLQEVAALARDEARAYARARGFISEGDLRPLTGRYVAALELAYAAAAIERRDVAENDPEGFYFYELLRGADEGERPPANEIPQSMRHARGLAAATAVRTYRRAVVGWLDDASNPARRPLEILAEHGKRIEALDGEIAPETADALVDAPREIGRYLRDGDDDALASARERLAQLGGE